MIPYDEKGFEEAAGTVLKPWVEKHVTGGTFSSFDKTRIQYYRATPPDAKAVIVMVHGFCEFFGKFHELAYHFWEQGYEIFFIEQRGHGGSGRSVKDPDLVNVGDFSEYVEDLKCLLDEVVLPKAKGVRTLADVRGGSDGGADEAPHKNLLLYAHSMGGCVGAMFLEKYPDYFIAAVLSSPMLKMDSRNTPAWKVKSLMALSHLPGWSKKPIPGTKWFDPEEPDFEFSGASSEARFLYQFEIRKDPATGGLYTMNGATYGWARAAFRATGEVLKKAGRIRIPLLICQAGEDRYVDNEGQDELTGRARYVRLVHFPKSEHEIYASDAASMEKYYREMDRFYDKARRI